MSAVREHISEITRPMIFPKFCAFYLWLWFDPPLAALGHMDLWRNVDTVAATDVIASSCAGLLDVSPTGLFPRHKLMFNN